MDRLGIQPMLYVTDDSCSFDLLECHIISESPGSPFCSSFCFAVFCCGLVNVLICFIRHFPLHLTSIRRPYTRSAVKLNQFVSVENSEALWGDVT